MFSNLAGADVEQTDYSRGLTALQWAKLCGSQDCVKALRKCKRSSTIKPQVSVTSNDTIKLAKSASDITKLSHNTSGPLKRLKDSLSHNQQQQRKEKEYLGIESIVASCVSSAPTIPMLIANSGCRTPLPEPLISPKLRRALALRPQCMNQINPHAGPPRIEVISEAGDRVAPNKHVYGCAKRASSAK